MTPANIEHGGIIHASTKGEQSRTRGTSGPECRKRRSPILNDPRQVAHGFDVVDHRWLTVQTSGRGKEGWLDAREASFAFESFDECRI